MTDAIERRVDVVLRASNSEGETLGITQCHYLGRMKTNDVKTTNNDDGEVYLLCAAPQDERILVSIMLVNNGARQDPDVLSTALETLDSSGPMTFSRPPKPGPIP